MLKLNGKELKTELFPNHEIRFKDFKHDIIAGRNILEFKYVDDKDLIALMFAKKRLDEMYVPTILFVWYMPYSRMDRMIEGDLYTLKYVIDFLNRLNFEKVIVMEPHSDKTMLMLIRSKDIYPVKYWLPSVKKDVGFSEENDFIVFPDKDAADRYKKSDYRNVCVFEKKRDLITGNIQNIRLKEGMIKWGSKCIIIDDLCSKGGTFSWIGDILKSIGASDVYLVVSHCEETIFNGKLLEDNSSITKIYTSTSMMDKKHPKIQYMNVDVNRLVNC